MLSTIASSMMTFTGLVFSITIVVLQLASSQFSPRVLRTFLEDRVTKLAMATFVGSFTYAVALLPEVRSAADDGGTSFVPGLSVFVAFVLAVGSVLVFVRYIHQMAHGIRAITVVRRVADETYPVLLRVYPERAGADEARPPEGEPCRVVPNGDERGVVAEVDEERLVALAVRDDAVIRLVPLRGAFVARGAPLFEVWGTIGESDRELRRSITLAPERTPRQDPTFGFRQLVDVAVRALSPGINDPSTAVQAIDQLHDLLRVVATRAERAGVVRDAGGRPRLFLSAAGFTDLARLAFDEIRLAGAGQLSVARRMHASLLELRACAPPDRHAVLDAQLGLLRRAVRERFPASEHDGIFGDAPG
jgi:uncharacterized membrane protein